MSKLPMVCEICGKDLPHTDRVAIQAHADAVRAANPGYAEQSRRAAKAAAEQSRTVPIVSEAPCTSASVPPPPKSTRSAVTSAASPRGSRPAAAVTGSRSRVTPVSTTPSVDDAIIAALLAGKPVMPLESSQTPVQPVSAPAPTQPTPKPSKPIQEATMPQPNRPSYKVPDAEPALVISLAGADADKIRQAWRVLTEVMRPDHIVVTRGKPGIQQDYRNPTQISVFRNAFVWDDAK